MVNTNCHLTLSLTQDAYLEKAQKSFCCIKIAIMIMIKPSILVMPMVHTDIAQIPNKLRLKVVLQS